MKECENGQPSSAKPHRQHAIRAGRDAIEYALLSVVIRPRARTSEDEADLADLYALLDCYNRVMKKYEVTTLDGVAANDAQGGLD